jgi:DNA-binding MarR family transcriptional regulator
MPVTAASNASDPVIAALIDRAQSVKQISERWLQRRLGGVGDGVTPSRLNVLILLHEEGPQKMGDIAKRARIAARSVTTLVDCLERDGLARRVKHPTDRRATMIELTPAGTEAVKDKSGPYWAATSLLFDALRPGEPEMLLSVYDRWYGIISEDLRRLGEPG